MAEFPALPLFTDAYLGDTRHLTTIEHGAYLLLLMIAWRTRDCRLPDDDRLLAKYAGLSLAQWRRMRPTITAFFSVVDGHLVQRRLVDEAAAVRQIKQRQSAGGKASALKRKGRHASDQQDSSSLLDAPTPTPTTVAKATGGKPPPDPVKALFDEGVALLTETGTLPSAARGLLGKWRKARGDDWVVRAIAAARTDRITDPVAWIEGRLRRSGADDGARDAYNSHIIEQARLMREADASAGEGRR